MIGTRPDCVDDEKLDLLAELAEYLSLVVEVLRRLRPDMAVERIASEVPMGFHHLTQWHLTRVSTLWSLLEKRLTARNAYQGEIFIPLRR